MSLSNMNNYISWQAFFRRFSFFLKQTFFAELKTTSQELKNPAIFGKFRAQIANFHIRIPFLPAACGMVFRRVEFSSLLGTFSFFWNLHNFQSFQKFRNFQDLQDFQNFLNFQNFSEFSQFSEFFRLFRLYQTFHIFRLFRIQKFSEKSPSFQIFQIFKLLWNS